MYRKHPNRSGGLDPCQWQRYPWGMGEPKLESIPLDQQISYRVNHLMFLNGRVSGRAIAMAIGISHTSFNNKLGGSRWTAEDLIRLSDYFGVSVDYLIGRLPLESASPVQQKTPAEAGVSGPGEEWARRGSNPRPAD